jgi:hypothetical protein
MIFKNYPYKFNIFVFVGDGPANQYPRHGYETRCDRRERTEEASIVEEPLENKDMEVDDLLKN